ncbi:MAG: GNAT family N-acetyltransferase [Bdellovibrionales bacterium]|nr:GNAT family N-acetyltransferase [Bdellovibrionales bacterium]
MAAIIRDLKKGDIPAVKDFTDHSIGKGYFTLDEVQDLYQRSMKDGIMCSQVLIEDGKILGVRITLPPGHWQSGKGQGLNEAKWAHPKKDTAYFQSLFIDLQHTGQGWGKKLSLRSIDRLKELGALGVLCHSWKESPHNSSRRYLESIGFRWIADHPMYWHEVNYQCTRCGQPCVCTAQEMYLDISSL